MTPPPAGSSSPATVGDDAGPADDDLAITSATIRTMEIGGVSNVRRPVKERIDALPVRSQNDAAIAA